MHKFSNNVSTELHFWILNSASVTFCLILSLTTRACKFLINVGKSNFRESAKWTWVPSVKPPVQVNARKRCLPYLRVLSCPDRFSIGSVQEHRFRPRQRRVGSGSNSSLWIARNGPQQLEVSLGTCVCAFKRKREQVMCTYTICIYACT